MNFSDDPFLLPDLAEFRAGASTSASTSAVGFNAFDFPLDPSLFGEDGAAGSSGGRALNLGATWNNNNDGGDDSEDDEDEDEDEDDSGDSDDDSDDSEDDYRPEKENGRRGVKRARDADGGSGNKKGKEKALNLDSVLGSGEEELGRLIHAIRDQTTSSVGGRTALDKEFDRVIEEDMEELDEVLGGGNKKRNRKKTSGRRAEPEPSHEVRHLLGRANLHYTNGEHDAAEELLTEIVRIDPSIRSPWYTLATIAEEKGDRERAVMFKIVATHLQSAKSAARDWAELGDQSRDIGLLQQAIYCFSQAIKGDKSDVNSMWDRAVLLKMSGSTRQAITAFTSLLSIHPHDPGVLRELAPLLASQGLFSRASALYLASYEYFRSITPHINQHPERDTTSISQFGEEDLEAIADYLLVQKDFHQAAAVIKEGSRWLQGREKETGWDKLDDDREYDERRKTRKGWEKESRHFEDQGIYDLDIRLRVRLGIARLMMGNVEEAALHYEFVLRLPVEDHPQLYGAIADAYLDQKMYNEALDVYQDMAENEETNGPPVWIKVGQCYQAIGELEDAKDCFEAATEAEPSNLAVKMQLAKVYEQLNQPALALETINSVIEAKRLLKEKEGTTGKPSQPRPNRRPTKADRASQLATEEQRHQEFALAFQKLSIIESKIEADGEGAAARTEWLEVATYLVDAFRETRQLFPSDGKRRFTGLLTRNWKRKGAGDNDVDVEAMASRLERTMQTGQAPAELEETTFRGLDFDGWLVVIIKYAFYLVLNDEFEAGLETLRHVQHASVFKQSPRRSRAIQLAYIACCLRAQSIPETLSGLRTLWLRQQFQSHPLRLLLGVLSTGSMSIMALRESTLQKFLTRQLHSIDDIANGTETKVSRGRIVLAGDKDKEAQEAEAEDEDDADTGAEGAERFKPTTVNPLYLHLYGSMLLISGTHQSAIFYLLRAYEIDPDQPLTNLSLAIAYLSRAVSRQSDNRQHQIAQALAFLSQYRKLRGPCQEVEYNFGRLFHHLGLHNYAVKHYSAVLKLASEEMPVDDDLQLKPNYAKVSAYNLSLVYGLLGHEVLARQIAANWLTI